MITSVIIYTIICGLFFLLADEDDRTYYVVLFSIPAVIYILTRLVFIK